MKRGNITKLKLNPRKPPKTDWRAFDAMSERRRHRAALADPDCPPATEAQLARARRVPTVRALRKKLKLQLSRSLPHGSISRSGPIGAVRSEVLTRKPRRDARPRRRQLRTLILSRLEPGRDRVHLDAQPDFGAAAECLGEANRHFRGDAGLAVRPVRIGSFGLRRAPLPPPSPSGPTPRCTRAGRSCPDAGGSSSPCCLSRVTPYGYVSET